MRGLLLASAQTSNFFRASSKFRSLGFLPIPASPPQDRATLYLRQIPRATLRVMPFPNRR